MEVESLLKVLLFCGITGFAFFCASYAFHVWRTRNKSVAGHAGEAFLGPRLRRWCAALVLLGFGLLAAAGVLRELSAREGVLSGDGLFTVRADTSLQPEYVIGQQQVKAGELLARFRSPERQAEMAECSLRREILQAQKEVLHQQPLVPDGELVRHIQNLENQRRELESSIRYLIPEHAIVVREGLRDRLDRLERLKALNTKQEETRREREQAIAEREKASRYKKRAEDLASQSAAAPLEFDDKITEATVLEVEVAKLAQRVSDLEAEKQQIESNLPEFGGCAARQEKLLADVLAQTKGQLEKVKTEQETLSCRLAEDLKRAESLNAARLSQIDLEIKQCTARLEGLKDVLLIKAPFDGRVAYCDPAPAMALPLAPVVILAPEQGFRFKVRMRESEIEPLSRAGQVPLRLVDGVLHRRFPGSLLAWERIPWEPGYALAELLCTPPVETVRDLASGGAPHDHSTGSRDVRIELMWRPPLWVSPLFWPSIGMLSMGTFGWFSSQVVDRRCRKRSRQVAGPSADLLAPAAAPSGAASRDDVSRPVGASVGRGTIELGAAGRNLDLLGRRFREAISREDVSPELLSALEWAIDRHHVRGIRCLSSGLDGGEELAKPLGHLLGQLADDRCPRASADSSSDLTRYERLVRIMRAISPELLAAGTREMLNSSGPIQRNAGGKPSGIGACWACRREDETSRSGETRVRP